MQSRRDVKLRVLTCVFDTKCLNTRTSRHTGNISTWVGDGLFFLGGGGGRDGEHPPFNPPNQTHLMGCATN